MQYRIPPAADDDASCLPAVSAKAAGAGAMLPSRRLAGARRRPPSAAYIGRGGLIRSSSPASSPADLLCLQRIRGEFSWGPALESALGMQEEEALALGPAGVAEGVWLTALAVLYLEWKAGEEGEGVRGGKLQRRGGKEEYLERGGEGPLGNHLPLKRAARRGRRFACFTRLMDR